LEGGTCANKATPMSKVTKFSTWVRRVAKQLGSGSPLETTQIRGCPIKSSSHGLSPVLVILSGRLSGGSISTFDNLLSSLAPEDVAACAKDTDMFAVTLSPKRGPGRKNNKDPSAPCSKNTAQHPLRQRGFSRDPLFFLLGVAIYCNFPRTGCRIFHENAKPPACKPPKVSLKCLETRAEKNVGFTIYRGLD